MREVNEAQQANFEQENLLEYSKNNDERDGEETSRFNPHTNDPNQKTDQIQIEQESQEQLVEKEKLEDDVNIVDSEKQNLSLDMKPQSKVKSHVVKMDTFEGKQRLTEIFK